MCRLRHKKQHMPYMVLQADSHEKNLYKHKLKTNSKWLIHRYIHGKNIINLKWDRSVYKTKKINKQVSFKWSKIPRGPYPSIGQESRTLLLLWVPVLFPHRWDCRPSLCRSFQDWIFLSSLHTAVSLEGHPCQLGIRVDRLWRESLRGWRGGGGGREEEEGGGKICKLSEGCCLYLRCVGALFHFVCVCL